MKKILLGVSSFGVIITPIATVIACGSKNNDNSKKSQTQPKKEAKLKDWGVQDVSTAARRAALLKKLTTANVNPKGTITILGKKMDVANAIIELQQWDANHPTATKPGKNQANPLDFTSLERIKIFSKYTILQIQASNGEYHYKIKGTLIKSATTYDFVFDKSAAITTGVFPYADLQAVKNAIAKYLTSITPVVKIDYENLFRAKLGFQTKVKLLKANDAFLTKVKALPMKAKGPSFLKREYYYIAFDDLASKFQGYKFKVLTAADDEKIVIAIGPNLFSGDETYGSAITITNLSKADFGSKSLTFEFSRGVLSKITFKDKPNDAAVATPKVATKLQKKDIYNAFSTSLNWKSRPELIKNLKTLDESTSPVSSTPDADNNFTKTYSLTFDNLSSATSKFKFKLVVALDGTKIIVPIFEGRSLNSKLLNYPSIKDLEKTDIPAGKKISLVFQFSTTNDRYSKLISFEISD